LKADILALAESRGVSLRFDQGEEHFGHRGQTAILYNKENPVGYLLRIKPSIEKELDCAPLFAFELDLEPFESPSLPEFKELSAFPPVLRDISMFVPLEESMERVVGNIREQGGSLLQDVRLFDVYAGKGVPDGFRGLAFSLAYKQENRTLTDGEVDEVNDKVRDRMISCGYTLR